MTPGLVNGSTAGPALLTGEQKETQIILCLLYPSTHAGFRKQRETVIGTGGRS